MNAPQHERRELDVDLNRLAQILISQNEAISRVQLEQNKSTAESISSMAKSIDKQSEVLTALLVSSTDQKKELEYTHKDTTYQKKQAES